MPTVIAIIMCTKYSQPSKALTLTAIILVGAALLNITIFVIAGVDMDGTEFFQIPVAICVFGLFIAGYVIMNIEEKSNVPAGTEKAKGALSKNTEQKIALLDKMKAEGKITEEEYKKLLLQELEK